MSESETREWQAVIHIIALDVENAAVLLQKKAGQTYALPSFTTAGGRWETTPAQLQEEWDPALPMKGQILYRADYWQDVDNCQAEAVIVLDTDSPQTLDADWFTLAGLNDLNLVQPAHYDLLEQLLAELETGQLPAQRPPWARPGWLEEASQWMTAELTKIGWKPMSRPEMGRSWALSYVMSIESQNEETAETARIFFKTSLDLPLFVNEALVTEDLAARFPRCVPRPLAVNGQKNWMLLADFGPVVGHNAPLEDRLEILHQFAEIQKESAEQLDQLIAAGCIDRRLEWLLGEIKPLLNHPEVEKALTAEETAQLRSMAVPLEKMARKLYQYAIPDVLIHGDLHGGNVARNDQEPGKLLFFDWTDAAVSHPFFDMLLIYTIKDTAERETMRDYYLSHWSDYESQARLLEIWQLAEVVAAVYHAISYLYIFNGVEDWGKTELYGAMPYWLNKILGYKEFIHGQQ